MKKLLCSLSLFILCGCSGASDKENVKPIETVIDYIEFRDTKIVLTENKDDMLFQFNDLGCEVNEEKIDTETGYLDINCFNEDSIVPFSISMDINENSEITTWLITSDEQFTLYRTDGQKLVFSKDSKQFTPLLDELIKVFGEGNIWGKTDGTDIVYVEYPGENYNLNFWVDTPDIEGNLEKYIYKIYVEKAE